MRWQRKILKQCPGDTTSKIQTGENSKTLQDKPPSFFKKKGGGGFETTSGYAICVEKSPELTPSYEIVAIQPEKREFLAHLGHSVEIVKGLYLSSKG